MRSSKLYFNNRSLRFLYFLLVILFGFSCQPVKNIAHSKPKDSFTFFVLGDWGMKGGFYQKPVAKQMIQQSLYNTPDMIVTAGDNFYDSGSVKSVSDEHWKLSYEDVYNELATKYPWYISLGNHDYQGNIQAQMDYGKINPNWILPDRYYTFVKKSPDGQKVRFVIIDTNPYVSSYYSHPLYKEAMAAQDTASQTHWLDSVLVHSREEWKIVIGHHPIYCVGGKPEHVKEMQNTILPILKRNKVQAYICGHDHVFQYHLPSESKIGFIISGTGAKPLKRAGKESFTLFSSTEPGFTICKIRGDELSFNFIDTTGNTIYSNSIKRN